MAYCFFQTDSTKEETTTPEAEDAYQTIPQPLSVTTSAAIVTSPTPSRINNQDQSLNRVDKSRILEMEEEEHAAKMEVLTLKKEYLILKKRKLELELEDMVPKYAQWMTLVSHALQAVKCSTGCSDLAPIPIRILKLGLI